MPSNYFSRLGTAIHSSVLGKETGIQDSAEVLFGLGKLWFGGSKFFHSVNKSTSSCLEATLLVRPGVDLVSSPESIGKRKTLSVVDTVSRTFSVPSVSGPSIQVCGYHIDCNLSGTDKFSAGAKFQIKTMAARLPGTFVGECSVDNLTLKRGKGLKNRTNVFLNTGLGNGRKLSMSLNNHQQPDSHAIFGYFVCNVAKSWHSSFRYTQSGYGDFHSSSTSCDSVGPAHDVPFDTSAREQKLTNSADSTELKSPSGNTLKLVSGSCYLPHPDKEETGGEDAHFICSEEQAIGVADGVGGWADLGVDSGYYSRELMSHSVDAIQEEPKGSVDPARVLEKAHSSTKAKGSSTACIIALTDQGLNAINLGDSGFMVIRDGCTIFRSPVQQHDFNFTYQLECGRNGDLPSSGQVFTVAVAPGDVIVAGTDGLFDNLYNNEITAVVVHGVRAGLSPQVTAQKIAALARQRALDKDRQTPFSTAAQDAGFRYYGGKLDDTTVVVSYITGSGDA
ncbi:probable protein phosphatase 2C 55 isoform X1 [Cicer arietinum]|uniref:Protein phosphatase n=2 Tax=Cicer arietinum TaxID=3827 RepID=A0A1S2Y4E6_CICAR|nr:probable protein phosphatase 2C 55 isoform X1 [Cicer arietinum]